MISPQDSVLNKLILTFFHNKYFFYGFFWDGVHFKYQARIERQPKQWTATDHHINQLLQ
jgi:hypothetical protein